MDALQISALVVHRPIVGIHGDSLVSIARHGKAEFGVAGGGHQIDVVDEVAVIGCSVDHYRGAGVADGERGELWVVGFGYLFDRSLGDGCDLLTADHNAAAYDPVTDQTVGTITPVTMPAQAFPMSKAIAFLAPMPRASIDAKDGSRVNNERFFVRVIDVDMMTSKSSGVYRDRGKGSH